jgi:hypothetical protein
MHKYDGWFLLTNIKLLRFLVWKQHFKNDVGILTIEKIPFNFILGD